MDIYTLDLQLFLYYARSSKCEQINAKQPALLAITEILKSGVMHRVADCYGPLVYSKFGQEGDNVDDLKTAYKQFFTDLESGISG